MATEASADPPKSLGAGKALQSHPKLRLMGSGFWIFKSDTEGSPRRGVKLFKAASSSQGYITLGDTAVSLADCPSSWGRGPWPWPKDLDRAPQNPLRATCFQNDVFLMKSTSMSTNKKPSTQANYFISLSPICSYTLKMRSFIRANRALLLHLSHRE